MFLSRRKFLALSSLGVPAMLLLSRAIAQTVPSPIPRMKLEDFVKDPMRMSSLKRGVANMKSRSPSMPGSWFFQGAIHAVSTEAVQAALEKDPDVANIDQARFWNQCPHSGQNSADFLIWHRAYIYYFERFLREASGDPTLSLPYWNYTEPNQRSFPQEFAEDDTDPVTQLPQNPLYDHRREQAFVFGLYQLTDRTAGTGVIFAQTDFFGENESSGFAGGVADNNVRTRGRIESQPHDLIHFAIGGAIGTGDVVDNESTVGMMASVQTAAFDPIFWVHHTNIDRLWTIWDCLLNPPRSWGKVPPKEWLEDRPWYFYDIDDNVKNQTRLYYLDRRNLQISYDSDNSKCSPLSATDPLKAKAPAIVTTFVVPQSIQSFGFKAEVGRVDANVRITPDKAVTTKIPLNTIPSLGGGSARDVVVAAASTGTVRRLVLEIVGIVIEGVTSVGYDIFVNVPAGKEPSRDSQNYVGTISLFGANHNHDEGRNHNTSINQSFDITRLSLIEGFDENYLNLTIEPFDLLEPKGNYPRLRRNVSISYTGIRLVILEGSTNPIL